MSDELYRQIAEMTEKYGYTGVPEVEKLTEVMENIQATCYLLDRLIAGAEQ